MRYPARLGKPLRLEAVAPHASLLLCALRALDAWRPLEVVVLTGDDVPRVAAEGAAHPAALFVIEPAAMAPLIDTWQGWIVCGVIAVLEIAGLLFIRRIMDIDI